MIIKRFRLQEVARPACVKATVIPKKSVIRLASTFCAVSDSELSTPHSRSRLPNIKKPISATESGAARPAIMPSPSIGNRMRVVLLILNLGLYFMRMRRSALVVIRRYAGGLHDRHQRHVRIRRNDNGAQILGA